MTIFYKLSNEYEIYMNLLYVGKSVDELNKLIAVIFYHRPSLRWKREKYECHIIPIMVIKVKTDFLKV